MRNFFAKKSYQRAYRLLYNRVNWKGSTMIRKLQPNEQAPMHLLLLADPSQEIVVDYLKRGTCFIAEQESQIVGVYVLLATKPFTVELVNVAVEPAWQGKGIGKQLVLHAIEMAKKEGYKTIEVGTGILV